MKKRTGKSSKHGKNIKFRRWVYISHKLNKKVSHIIGKCNSFLCTLLGVLSLFVGIALIFFAIKKDTFFNYMAKGIVFFIEQKTDFEIKYSSEGPFFSDESLGFVLFGVKVIQKQTKNEVYSSDTLTVLFKKEDLKTLHLRPIIYLLGQKITILESKNSTDVKTHELLNLIPKALFQISSKIDELEIDLKDSSIFIYNKELTIQNVQFVNKRINGIKHIIATLQDKNYNVKITCRFYNQKNGDCNVGGMFNNFKNEFQNIQKANFDIFSDFTNEKILLINGSIKADLLEIFQNDFLASNLTLNSTTFKLKYNEQEGLVANGETEFDKNKKIQTSLSIADLSKPKQFNLEVLAYNADIEDVKKFWPDKFLHSLKNWLVSQIQTAQTQKVKVTVDGKTQDFNVEIDLNNGTLDYLNIFPKLEQISGKILVDNKETIVKVNKAKAQETILLNSQATFDNQNSNLNLNLKTDSSLKHFVSFFFKDIPIVSSIVSLFAEGKVVSGSKINIPLNQNTKDIWLETSYDAKVSTQKLLTPFSENSNSFIFDIKKKPYSYRTIVLGRSSLDFINSSNIENIFLNLDIQPDHNIYRITDLEISGKNISGHGNFDFYNNNFDISLKSEKNDFILTKDNFGISLVGKSFTLEDFYKYAKLISKLESQDKTHLTWKDKIFVTDLDKLMLLSNFELKHLSIFKTNTNDLVVKSDKVEIQKDSDLIIANIKNLGGLISGLTDERKFLEKGTLKLNAKKDNKTNLFKGSATLENFDIILDGKSTSFKKAIMKFEYDEKQNILKITNLEAKNAIHYITINGSINLNNMILDINMFYTVSALERLNSIPLLKNALSLISLGGTKNGLVTLNYKITGKISKPEVIFKTFSTASNISKTVATGFGAVALLPFIIAIL